jgi:hypothetical protein
VLAEILGTQIAWWQLGFAARRGVLRAARRGARLPDQDVWQVAVGWAWQWLAAPRWWRLVRDVGATVLAMTCLGALVSVLAETDGLVTLAGAAVVCLPLAVGWGWRQARLARALVALAPESPPRQVPSPRFAVRALVALLAAGIAATGLTVGIAYEEEFWTECPSFTVDAPLRDWRARGGEGCPAGDTVVGAGGLRYTPWNMPERFTGRSLDYVAYVSPSAVPLVLPAAIFDAWIAEGGPFGRLGPAVDGGSNDLVAYLNLRGGAIVLPEGAAPYVLWGQRYSGVRDPDSACVPHDRPCVVAAYADGDGIRLRWHYGAADAFNVAWRPLGEKDTGMGREVTGYEVTLRGLRPSTVYQFDVAACRKRFLRRSVCTWPSAPVTVRVG